jgi:hypothetical protein
MMNLPWSTGVAAGTELMTEITVFSGLLLPLLLLAIVSKKVEGRRSEKRMAG